MDEDFITLEPGDTFELSADRDGYPAVKIQNTVWDEAPRWIISHFTGGDEAGRIDELIAALTELRDLVATGTGE